MGEAKTHTSFDEDDIRKLAKLADAVPPDVAQSFIMFAKTDSFTENEISLARQLNSKHKFWIILWSQDELEPYYAYENLQDRLPENNKHPLSLTKMAHATHSLYFTPLQLPSPPQEKKGETNETV